MTAQHLHTPFSRRELSIFLHKYRARLITVFTLSLFFFVALSFVPTPRYKAASVLVVRLGSEYVYQPETGNSPNGANSSILFNRDQIFKSEVAILNSDDLHKRVVETMGLQTLFPALAEPSGIVGNIRETFAQIPVTLGLRDEESIREEAQAQKQMARAVALFNKRFDILLEKDSAVITLSFEHKNGALAAKALDTLLELYFEKRQSLYFQPRTPLAQTEMKLRRAEMLTAMRNVESFRRKHALHSLDDQRTELLERQSEIKQQALTISHPSIERELSSYRGQLAQLDAVERELHQLENEAKIKEAAYNLYTHKLGEAEAFDNLQQERAGSVRIIQPPTVPAEAKNLQPIILLGGFFLSVIATLIAAALTECCKRGFTTPESLERGIDLPVLGVMPYRKHG